MSNPSTQKFVKIDHIRDDVVLVKGGEMRAVLQVSSMNFALKSSQEQDAIIFGYRNFLNSLDFSVQILVNSRFVNIDDYLNNLQQMIKTQKSELLKMQTNEYIKFIKGFVEESSIVTTDFYVIVPFRLVEAAVRRGGAGERFKGLFGLGAKISTAETEKFLHYKGQLMQRADFISGGLHRIGLTARMLTTEELISLYWSLYNPGDLRKKHLVKSIFEQ